MWCIPCLDKKGVLLSKSEQQHNDSDNIVLQYNTLKDDYDNKDKTLKNVEALLKQSENKVAKLQHKYHIIKYNSQKLDTQIEKEQQYNQKAKEHIEFLENRVKELENTPLPPPILQIKKITKCERVSSCIHTDCDMKPMLDSVQKNKSECEELRLSNKEMSQRLININSEHRDVISAYKSSNYNLSEERNQMRTEIEHMNKSMSRLNSEKERLESVVRRSDKTISVLQEKLDCLENEVKYYSKSMNNERQKNKKLQRIITKNDESD